MIVPTDGILLGKEVSYDDQEGVEKIGNNLQVQKLMLINALLGGHGCKT